MPKEIPDRLRAVCEWFPAAEAKARLKADAEVIVCYSGNKVWAFWDGEEFRSQQGAYALATPDYFCLHPTTPASFDRQQAEKRRRDEAGTPELFAQREPT